MATEHRNLCIITIYATHGWLQEAVTAFRNTNNSMGITKTLCGARHIDSVFAVAEIELDTVAGSSKSINNTGNHNINILNSVPVATACWTVEIGNMGKTGNMYVIITILNVQPETVVTLIGTPEDKSA